MNHAAAICCSILLAGCGEVVDSTATITITLAGNGTGEFQPSVGTVECTATSCTATIPLGASVTLIPAPATGSTFAKWTTAPCEQLESQCTFPPVSGDLAMQAEFTLDKVTLTVAKDGAGVAAITSTPAGIECGSVCSGEFDYGTMVTLTALTTAGTTLDGWSGADCTATADCTLMAATDTTITAALGCPSGSQTFEFTGTIETFAVPPCITSLTIDAYGAQGGNAGGKGARIRGTYAVGGGTMSVLVGEAGGTVGTSNGGGGGGTFVFLNEVSTNPIIAAGGGGGATAGIAGAPGSATTVPTATTTGAGNAAGGSSGAGGAGGTQAGAPNSPGTGGGGAGWRTAGAAGTVASQGGGGQPPRLEATGGAGGTNGAAGGFGGGGGSAGNPGAGGGGGGYSGGGGGNGYNGSVWGSGGGGGSYNMGTDQVNEAGVRDGNGQVIFTW